MPVKIYDRQTPVWNSTTAVVSGTADVNVIHQALWFEIRPDGGSGPLIDYGAFPQKPDWRFQARHLHFGDNQVPLSIKFQTVTGKPLVENAPAHPCKHLVRELGCLLLVSRPWFLMLSNASNLPASSKAWLAELHCLA